MDLANVSGLCSLQGYEGLLGMGGDGEGSQGFAPESSNADLLLSAWYSLLLPCPARRATLGGFKSVATW